MKHQQSPHKVIIALGGNALQKDGGLLAEDQINACKQTAKSIALLIQNQYQVGIVHGNGPQVGQIMETVSAAHQANKKHQLFKFDICGAFSQGYIGYHLQNAIAQVLEKNNIKKSVATIITQVEVHKDDPGFINPTKPIGPFYSEEEAKKMMSASGITMKEDAGRGWRRVIASPKPIDIVEKDMIKLMFESSNIVISCGGGGIPVIRNEKGLTGVEAVIDKDFAAAKLADILDAETLLILTTVEKVAINFNKPNQKNLGRISVEEALKYIDEKEFAEGSMLPKIQAAIEFIKSRKGRKAIITSLDKVYEAVTGLTGTIITS